MGNNACGLRLHTFFQLSLRNLGPQTPPDTIVAQFSYFEFVALYLGMDYYNIRQSLGKEKPLGPTNTSGVL